MAIVVFGSLIVRLTRNYELNVVEEKLDYISEYFLPKLEQYSNFEEEKNSINELLNNLSTVGFKEQIFVVQKNRIIASTSHKKPAFAEDVLNLELLIEAENGNTVSKVVKTVSENYSISSFDKVYPVYKNSVMLGYIYLKYDLSDVEEKTKNSVFMIIKSLAVALSITLFLSVITASSIVNPIKNITKKATKFAGGDFDQRIDVKSNDEIGELSSTFNYMADTLSSSLEDLSNEKNKLEVVVNTMADGLIAVDNNREIMLINPTAKRFLSKLGIYDYKLYDDIAENLPKDLKFEHIVGNKDIKVEIEGENYLFLVRGETLYGEYLEILGFILVFQDSTKEHRLEKMRREFVANVSHELKTPITSIKSYSETLLENDKIDKDIVLNFLGVINSEATRMGRLVNDLLELSNYDSDIVNLEYGRYSVTDLLKSIVNKLQIRLRDKNIDCKIVCDEDIVAEFDYDRMEQVFVNIVVNAIKYTEEEGIINIYISKTPKEAVVTVEDNGIGIAEEHIDNLFNRFYRVDKARERSRGGSGLGLSIVSQILELHRGSVVCESEVNVGTKMHIRFPLEKSEGQL